MKESTHLTKDPAPKISRAFTIDNIRTKKFTGVKFKNEWADAIGDNIPLRDNWMIFGGSGSGKTTMMLRLVKYLAQFKPILYNSLEEGLSPSIQLAFKKNGLFDLPNNRIHLVSEDIDALTERLAKPRSRSIVVIDSVPYANINWRKYQAFTRQFPNKLFIWVEQKHRTKDAPSTTIGDRIWYDSMVKIRTECFRAFVISRLRERADAPDFIDIWPEKAQAYFGDIPGIPT